MVMAKAEFDPYGGGKGRWSTHERSALTCRMDRLLVLLLLLLTLTMSSARPAMTEERPFAWHEREADGSVRVMLYVFWSESCPHCHRALRFLETVTGELPWLKVQALEVSAPENMARYLALAEHLGTEARYVPAFFYCGHSFQGYDDDGTTGRALRQGLEACHAELLGQTGTDRSSTDPAAAEAGAPPIDLPLVGRLDPSALSLPVLTVVLAGLDAFNPCAFFVLLVLLSLMVHARSRGRMALVGGLFVLTSGLAYFVFMAAWLNLFLLLGYLPLLTIGAGLVALLIGVINVKDFFWPTRGITLSIPERTKPGLYGRARDLVASASLPAMLAGTMGLALAANAYELLCTAGFPLVFTRILTLADLHASAYYGYLALYNLVYMLPLLAIVAGFVVTLGARKLQEEEGRILKLLSGLMMLGLGLMLLLAPDALSHPLVALALMTAALVGTAIVVFLARGTTVSRQAP
jgi:hypothetical protein